MAIPGAAYWAKRSAARMDQYLWRGNETLDIISHAHKQAQADILAAIDRIYAKIGRTYDMKPDEIVKMLSQPAGRAEYESLLQTIKGIKDPKLRLPLEARAASGAYAFRISRLDALRENVRAQAARLADIELEAVTGGLTRTITEAYSRTMFDLQRGTGFGFPFAQMSTGAVNEILHNPWSGSTFSSRIWQAQDVLAKQLNEKLTAGFMSGRGNAQLSRDLADTMGVSYRNAERLVRTETNYMANAATMRGYGAAGIEKYEYMASLDNRTSEICQELDGQVFAVRDAKAGVNMPPMHPHCRSTTVAHFDDDAVQGLQRRARDPVTGEQMLVPLDMKYAEWEKRYGSSPGNISANIGQYLKAGVSLQGIPRDVVAGIEQSYRTVMRRWPQLQGEFRALGTNEKRPGVYASCYLSTGEVNVNPQYFQDKAALKRSYDKDVAANWHPVGTTWGDIVTHELGHAIDGYLTRNISKIPGISATQGRASTHIMNEVLRALKKTPGDISAGLSDYASTKPEEFFAEAMAEYLGSWMPRPMAKRTGKIVDSWMKDIARHP